MRILLAVCTAAALLAPTTLGWDVARAHASAGTDADSASVAEEGSQSPASSDAPGRDEGEESSGGEEDSSDSKFTGPVHPIDAAFPSLQMPPLMGSLVGLGPRLGHETELERPPRA